MSRTFDRAVVRGVLDSTSAVIEAVVPGPTGSEQAREQLRYSLLSPGGVGS